MAQSRIRSMLRNPQALLSFALCLGMATGCQSTNTYSPGEEGPSPSARTLDQIITDPSLNRRARVRSVNTSRQNGLLRVQVNLSNKNIGSKRLEPDQLGYRYKFAWFDDEGMKISDPNESWKRKTLEARELTTITATAPTPEASDWRLALHSWDGH